MGAPQEGPFLHPDPDLRNQSTGEGPACLKQAPQLMQILTEVCKVPPEMGVQGWGWGLHM